MLLGGAIEVLLGVESKGISEVFHTAVEVPGNIEVLRRLTEVAGYVKLFAGVVSGNSS